MSEEGVERRLTTILAADVVGYSRLMGEDEAGTLAALKAHRQELIDPKAAPRCSPGSAHGAPEVHCGVCGGKSGKCGTSRGLR